jgi:hypothetical protein
VQDLDRGRELIEKYLDNVVDEAELAELELLLTTDPEVAREFARAARTDNSVYTHFNREHAEQVARAATQKLSIPMPDLPPAPVSPRPFVGERLTTLRARRHLRTLVEHLIGPTGSILLHVVVIALVIVVISRQPPPPPPAPPGPIVKLQDDEPLQFEPPPPEPGPESAVTPGELAAFTSVTVEPEPLVPPDVEPVEAPEPKAEPLPEVEKNRSPMTFSEYGSRSGKARKEALERYGGSAGEVTEPAVLRALDWLKKHQQPDGSWGPNPVAMTGLGLLTFLAHGETPSSTEYGPTVELAMRYLLKKQSPSGSFVDTSRQYGPYEHGIATYAIAEAYGMTRIDSLKPAMEKAVQVILDGQQAGGGWDYSYGRGGRRDTSVAGWQIQALKAARISGAENPRLKEALQFASLDLRSAQEEGAGWFRYSDKTSSSSPGLTGVGVLCLDLLGESGSREVRDGLAALSRTEFRWRDAKGWALYSGYYITQAKFHEGGASWKKWNMQFAKEYSRAQNRDGSWSAPSQEEQKYGPVYSTTLAALTLQVYYRRLPTFEAISVKGASADPKDDVEVNVR